MKKYQITLQMQSYIAHPFWPARNICIEVEKKSGVNRQKSEDKRIAALKAECQKQGITYEQYLEYRKQAAEEWYRKGPDIMIPRHQMAGALVQAIAGAPKALRGLFSKDNFRALVQIGDFVTDRRERSGVFDRFVKLEGSNQRSRQANEYIGVYLDEGEPFTASGIIVCEEKQAETVKSLLAEAVQNIGVGAARKMGFGRGIIKN